LTVRDTYIQYRPYVHLSTGDTDMGCDYSDTA